MVKRNILVGLCGAMVLGGELLGRSATVVFSLEKGPARVLRKKTKPDVVNVTIRDVETNNIVKEVTVKPAGETRVELEGRGDVKKTPDFTLVAKNPRTGASSKTYKLSIPAVRGRIVVIVTDRGLRERIKMRLGLPCKDCLTE